MTCCVCAALTPDAFELPRDVAVCRNCVHRIGHVLDRSTDAFVAGLWRSLPPPTAPESREHSRERALADFKAGVAATLSRDDFAAHADLAKAYAEMGLALDAIREASIALDRRAPPSVAQGALMLVFGEHARPDAFDDVLVALRSTN